jgi:uncharacterized membrane protein
VRIHGGRREVGTSLVSKVRIPAPVPELTVARRPTVSVVIPCYNYGHFLPACLGSVVDQDQVETEVIIVDDASTDDSAAVAWRYTRRCDNMQVILHRSNTGHVVAFNDGLDAATGEFVVRLDADDLLAPGSLARAVALFDEFPSVGLVYGHPRHFTTETPPTARTKIRGWTVWDGEDWVAYRCRRGFNCITTPEVMIRSSVLQSIGGLNTTLRFAQDMEMWLRTASVSDVGRIDGPDQALHRDHPASMSATDGAGQLLDLQERAGVFDVLFAGPGGRLPGASELHKLARRALAAEALRHAYHAYDRGRTGTVDVEGYVEFALATYPEAGSLPQWRALQRRTRVGARLAPVVPAFIASVIWRRLHWEAYRRRWRRTGL